MIEKRKFKFWSILSMLFMLLTINLIPQKYYM